MIRVCVIPKIHIERLWLYVIQGRSWTRVPRRYPAGRWFYNLEERGGCPCWVLAMSEPVPRVKVAQSLCKKSRTSPRKGKRASCPEPLHPKEIVKNCHNAEVSLVKEPQNKRPASEPWGCVSQVLGPQQTPSWLPLGRLLSPGPARYGAEVTNRRRGLLSAPIWSVWFSLQSLTSLR